VSFLASSFLHQALARRLSRQIYILVWWKKLAKGIQKVSSGWASWKWLSGIDAKQRMWFLGAVQGRQGFQSWMTHMVKGLQEPECQR
jgi:hypothetical protein